MTMTEQARGFTRLEYALAIALVAVLALVALPALRKAQEARHLALCQHNLRQWAVVFSMYAGEDPEGYYPPMSDYAYDGDVSTAFPDLRSIYPAYMNNPTMGSCPSDSRIARRGRTGSHLPYQEGTKTIRELMERGEAAQDCMLLHWSLARSYVYFNYAVLTPAEGEVAWRAWGDEGAGGNALRAATGGAHDPRYRHEEFGVVVDLGSDCPYRKKAIHLRGRFLGGTLADLPTVKGGPFTTREGDVLTAWRGDPGETGGLGWDPETGRRVPDVIFRLRNGLERTVRSPHSFPVMWDIFAPSEQTNPEYPYGSSSGRGVLESNHVPRGANVLFLDGSVEFVRWWPPTGARFPLKRTDHSLNGDGKYWLQGTVGDAL